MKGLIGVGVLVLGLQGIPVEPGEVRPGDVFLVRLKQSRDGFVVGQAVQGAHRRLADPGCNAVFSDFTESANSK